MARIPQAVAKYIAEYEQTETDVRDYIVMQIGYYHEIREKGGTTAAQWLGFKMGCSSAAAATAIKWANKETK